MRPLLILLGMVLIAGSVLLYTSMREDDGVSRFGRDFKPRAPSNLPPAGAAPSVVSRPSVPVHPARPPRLPPEVRDEASRAGRLDPDPRASERRLNEIAAHLSPGERRELRDVVLDANSPGDDRATAAEVLARSKQDDAVGLLADVALRPVPDARPEQKRDFERVLRARAIEGLGQTPAPGAAGALREVLARVNDSFLVDRAHRAAWSRAAVAPSPAEQDRRALGELLDRDRPGAHR